MLRWFRRVGGTENWRTWSEVVQMVQVRVLCAPKFGALMRDTLRPDANRSSPRCIFSTVALDVFWQAQFVRGLARHRAAKRSLAQMRAGAGSICFFSLWLRRLSFRPHRLSASRGFILASFHPFICSNAAQCIAALQARSSGFVPVLWCCSGLYRVSGH